MHLLQDTFTATDTYSVVDQTKTMSMMVIRKLLLGTYIYVLIKY